MTAGQIKFFALLFALVNVWLVFHIPAVSEATLKFMSVGEIPGTERSLSPDTMLYLAIGLFALMVVSIVWRLLYKRAKRRRQQQAGVPAPVAAATDVTALPSTASVPKRLAVVRPQLFMAPRAHSGKSQKSQRMRKWVVHLRAQLRALGAMARVCGVWLRRGALRAWRQIVAAGRRWQRQMAVLARQAWRWIVPRYWQLATFIVQVGQASVVLSRDLWRWLVPRIRAADQWLETQLRGNRRTAGAIKATDAVLDQAAQYGRTAKRFAFGVAAAVRDAWRSTRR